MDSMSWSPSFGLGQHSQLQLSERPELIEQINDDCIVCIINDIHVAKYVCNFEQTCKRFRRLSRKYLTILCDYTNPRLHRKTRQIRPMHLAHYERLQHVYDFVITLDGEMPKYKTARYIVDKIRDNHILDMPKTSNIEFLYMPKYPHTPTSMIKMHGSTITLDTMFLQDFDVTSFAHGCRELIISADNTIDWSNTIPQLIKMGFVNITKLIIPYVSPRTIQADYHKFPLLTHFGIIGASQMAFTGTVLKNEKIHTILMDYVIGMNEGFLEAAPHARRAKIYTPVDNIANCIWFIQSAVSNIEKYIICIKPKTLKECTALLYNMNDLDTMFDMHDVESWKGHLIQIKVSYRGKTYILLNDGKIFKEAMKPIGQLITRETWGDGTMYIDNTGILSVPWQKNSRISIASKDRDLAGSVSYLSGNTLVRTDIIDSVWYVGDDLRVLTDQITDRWFKSTPSYKAWTYMRCCKVVGADVDKIYPANNIDLPKKEYRVGVLIHK